jgi:archaetidylinositol phosphate synthase
MIKEKSKTWAAASMKLGATFGRLPMSPDFYSWMTFPIALLGLLLLAKHHIFTGIIVFLLSGLLDLVDGAVARHTGKQSCRGAFLDGSLDRFIDFFLIFSYFWMNITTPWMEPSRWICMAVFLAIMPSFEVAYANHRQAVPDPEEKIIWRILNRGEMYFIMLVIPLLSLISAKWAGYLLVVLVILSLITTLQTFFATLYIAKRYNND